ERETPSARPASSTVIIPALMPRSYHECLTVSTVSPRSGNRSQYTQTSGAAHPFSEHRDRVDERAGAGGRRDRRGEQQELPSMQASRRFCHRFEIEVVEDVDSERDQREL